MIRRGKARGQIQDDADEDILIDLVSGAYFYYLTFTPEKLSTEDWLKKTMKILATGVKT
ncbi:TetR-like C-terminal domain-containing protein [Cytobacillus dafuensis]|uniref:Tetracyclin repressor-like C-terminal domain-containing protein n=1 Tax=Cytobacillus dafuensis TaxID=1742359 RepID=A0A5B8ZD88_CYTDA|nr:hypothetical protein FSZ17_21150 [Cytobacillus dafuensis]